MTHDGENSEKMAKKRAKMGEIWPKKKRAGRRSILEGTVLLGCRVVLKVREAVEADGLVHERSGHRLLDQRHRRRREVYAVFRNYR